jgi:uncharacterized membrane protein
MITVEETIEVDVSCDDAYEQWARFEEFPEFMERVAEVIQLDDTRLHFRADLGGDEEEWYAEVIEAVPGERIAWRRTVGPVLAYFVRLAPLADGGTRVSLMIEWDSRLLYHQPPSAVHERVRRDLQRFKARVERDAVSPWVARAIEGPTATV